MEVIPGILEKEWSEIEKKIELVRPFVQTIHIDIIDGKFAPNTTFLDPSPFKKYTSPSAGSGLFFELHMMVENPLEYLKPWADAGFARFLGHIEKMPDQVEFVAQGQLIGEVGLAIDLKTPLDAVKVPFEDLDNILLMSVPAGFSGQGFDPSVLEKIKEVTDKTFIPIEVDGGINDSNIFDIKEAGATSCAVTHFIFNGNIEEPAQKTPKLTLTRLWWGMEREKSRN